MSIDRRDFLKASTAGAIGMMSSLHNTNLVAAAAPNGLVTLRVRVEGLGGLVLRGAAGPDIPRDVPGADFVLIANGYSTLEEPRHRPRLFILESQLADQTRNWQREPKKPGIGLTPARSRAWKDNLKIPDAAYKPLSIDLRDYHVSFAGGAPGPVTLSRGDIKPGCPPVGPGWASIHWLANLHKICGHGAINPACLTMNPPRAVSSRVSFTGGTLSCVEPSNTDYAQKVWKFARKDGTRVVQAVADAVEHVAVAQKFTLILTPFAGVAGVAAKPIEIELAPGVAKEVSVVIQNMPSDEIETPIHIEHFKAYYDLLDTRPAETPTPHLELMTCTDMRTNVPPTDSDPNYCPSGVYFAPGSGDGQ